MSELSTVGTNEQYDDAAMASAEQLRGEGIAFWDNRAVQHDAASDYYPHRRMLRRVTVAGDRPRFDPAAEVVQPD